MIASRILSAVLRREIQGMTAPCQSLAAVGLCHPQVVFESHKYNSLQICSFAFHADSRRFLHCEEGVLRRRVFFRRRQVGGPPLICTVK